MPRIASKPFIRGAAGLALGACVLIAGAAGAAEYSVQIGAFREANASFTAKADRIGQSYTTRTASGVLRVQVGPYSSFREARTALAALKDAGYADAFIRKRSASGASTTAATRMEAAPRAIAASTRSAAAPARNTLEGVPPELRERVVLLDGEYHVKDGDRFTPLRDYRQ